MADITTSEAMVQDQTPTPAPEAGAEQKESSESMENKDQDASIRTLGEQLAGEEATKVPTTETPDAPDAPEADTTESTEEKVDGTTMTDEEKLAFLEDVENLPALATLLSFLPKYIQKHLVIRVSYRKAVAAGAIMVYSDVNREIDNAQVGKLEKSLKDKTVKVYKKAATVIHLRDILEYQEAHLEESKRRHFFRFETGEEITLDTPAEILDKCYYVDDGQHRIFTCIEDSELDVNMEILPYNGEDLQESVTEQNSLDKNWTKSDYEHSLIESGVFDGTHYQQREQLVENLGITAKTAEMYLTFKTDANTKSQLAKGKQGISWNDADCARGEDLAYAVSIMSNSTEVKKLPMIKGIVYIYQECLDDKTRSDFRDVMVSLLTSLSEDEVTTIVAYLSSNDEGQLKKYLKKKYFEFRSAHAEDLPALLEMANSLIAEKKEALGTAAASVKLRQARPEKLLEYRKAAADEKTARKEASAERAKAKREAEKLAKKITVSSSK